MNELNHIQHFIAEHHLLTLCASFNDNIWSANCYYVFDRDNMVLYIMTSPETRHGSLMLKNHRIAGTIAPEPSDVSDIQGIQFSGQIYLLDSSKEQHALALYYAKFPIAKNMPSSIWQITLDELKMTDNRIKFGFKLNWQRRQL